MSQVLILVKASGVNPIDTHFREGEIFPPSLPFTPGLDSAGVVEEVGSGVTKFKVKDETDLYCLEYKYRRTRKNLCNTIILKKMWLAKDMLLWDFKKRKATQYKMRYNDIGCFLSRRSALR